MLSHGGFAHCNSLSHKPISKSLLFPTKTHLNFVLNQVSHHKFPSFHAPIRIGSSIFASKSPKTILKPLSQTDEIDEDDDDDLKDIDNDDDYDNDDDDDEEEDDLDLDLVEMSDDYKEALEKSNKLLAEFEQSKTAPKAVNPSKLKSSLESRIWKKDTKTVPQAVNPSKSKNSLESRIWKKDTTQQQTVKKASRKDVSVRLRNLPRKKNIKRDLIAAFKEFPGILNIVPAVNGKNAKEPSCRGHAFVYFKSLSEANRFVELFSGQILTFGKIQQKIDCVVVNPSSPNATNKEADNKLVLPLVPLDPSSEDQNPQLATNSEDPIDEKVSKTRLYTGILDNFTSLESIDSQKEIK